MKNRIRQLREERRMTQLRLSIELEVSQETISAYERQKHYPGFQQLLKMSRIFSASIDYIMGLSDVRNPVHQIEDGCFTELVSQAKRLNQRQMELVLSYIQGLIDMGQN